MGHRPVAGQGIVLQRQPLTLVRQPIEPAVLHRLPDLPFDQRLAELLP